MYSEELQVLVSKSHCICSAILSSTAFHLNLHCLPSTLLRSSSTQRVNYKNIPEMVL